MKKKLLMLALAAVTMTSFTGCTAVDYLGYPYGQTAYVNTLTPFPVIPWSDYDWDWGPGDVDVINQYNYLATDYNREIKNPDANPENIDALRDRLVNIRRRINDQWGNDPERRDFINAFNNRAEYHYTEMGGYEPKGFKRYGSGRGLRDFHTAAGGYAGVPNGGFQGNFNQGFSHPGFNTHGGGMGHVGGFSGGAHAGGGIRR